VARLLGPAALPTVFMLQPLCTGPAGQCRPAPLIALMGAQISDPRLVA